MKDNYSLNFQSQYKIIKLQLSILIIGYLGLILQFFFVPVRINLFKQGYKCK